MLESTHWGHQFPELGVASTALGTCRSMQRVWAVGGDRLAQRPFPSRSDTQNLPTAAAAARLAGHESNILLGLETRTDYLKGRKLVSDRKHQAALVLEVS